jgi:hypothetical protein
MYIVLMHDGLLDVMMFVYMVILKCELFMEYAMSCEKLKGNSSLWMGHFYSVHNAF